MSPDLGRNLAQCLERDTEQYRIGGLQVAVLEECAGQIRRKDEAFVLVGQPEARRAHFIVGQVTLRRNLPPPIAGKLRVQAGREFLSCGKLAVRLPFEEYVIGVQAKRRRASGKLHFVAPGRQIVLVPPRPVKNIQMPARRGMNPGDDVGQVVLQTGLVGEGVVALEPIALPHQDCCTAAIVSEYAPSQAVVKTWPAFHAIDTRESIRSEQVGLVELEVLAVLLGMVFGFPPYGETMI